MSEKLNYALVYSLSQQQGLDIILPVAYIVEVDNSGKLAYMKAQALEENINSYGINIKGTIHDDLMDLCKELDPSKIEKHFNKNLKKKQSINLLFGDPKLKKTIQSYTDTRMVKFLILCNQHQIHICYEIKRKICCEDVRLVFGKEKLKSVLHFRKTQTGIHYILKIKIQENIFSPLSFNIHLITDMPGWLIINGQIVELENLNSAKLRPFLKQESLFIPSKLTIDYFERFIKDIIGITEIETEGFELLQNSYISNAKINATYDIFSKKWLAEIIFDYSGKYFNFADLSRKKTKIDILPDGEVKVYQTIRNNVLEIDFVEKLKSIGLTQTSSNRFEALECLDPYQIFVVIGENKKFLDNHFEFIPFTVENRELTLSTAKLNIDVFTINDWFDLKGKLEIEGITYPLSAFFNNIRRNDPFFKLTDGRYFILPASLMTKYESIATFGKSNKEHWLLPKSNYPLLENIEDYIPLQIDFIGESEIKFVVSSKLKAKLRPYQTEGVKWLYKHYRNGLGACLADDMGLGKTLQIIALLCNIKDEIKEGSNQSISNVQLTLFTETVHNQLSPLKTLIVLPASLVFNWAAEINKFAPHLHVKRYTGLKRIKDIAVLSNFDIILTTYQTVVSDINTFIQIDFNYVILDESQQIRNHNTKVFKSLIQLKTKNKISLSGTPIENSLSDLWSQMQFINADILGTYSFFKQYFQTPIEKSKDSAIVAKLKSLVLPFILRRTKEQVATDLPELSQQICFIEMDEKQKQVFERERSSARNFILGLDTHNKQFRFHVLTVLMKLRLLANHPVLIDEAYNGGSGKFEEIKFQLLNIWKAGYKVLVFSSFKIYLQLFVDWLEAENIGYLILTGDTRVDLRSKLVHEFQENGEKNIFLITLKAGGVGLNLTAADYVFILDPWWNPFIEKQAIGRAHRIGRTKPVLVTRFISKDSIEEKILHLQQFKKDLSDQIIEVDDVPQLDNDDLLSLI